MCTVNATALCYAYSYIICMDGAILSARESDAMDDEAECMFTLTFNECVLTTLIYRVYFSADSLDRSAGYIQRAASALQCTPQANVASSNWGIQSILTAIHSGDHIEVCSLFFVLAIQQVSVTIYQYAPCSLLSSLGLLLKTSRAQMPLHKSSACSYTLSICCQLTTLGFGSTLL